MAIAGTVVGEYAADREAEAGVKGPGHEKEAYSRLVGLVGQDGGEADARVVVDGDVQVLPAHAARLLVAISGDTMTGLADARQPLDVEVDQVAGPLVLVTDHRQRRIERTQAVKSGATQDAADGRPAQTELFGDAPAIPALLAKS